MKRISLFYLAILLTGSVATAQISPENYAVEHKDSSWYITLDYNVEKIPSNDGMLLITHLCNNDTCISSTTRHFQGKKYAKRYTKRHGHHPGLQPYGSNQCTIILPENHAIDTLWGVTYSEYSDKNGTTYALDTMEIILPASPSLCCHKVSAARTIADHIAQEHPYVKSIRHYAPLTTNQPSTPTNRNIVRYRSNSPLLDAGYMQNAKSIDEIMAIVEQILGDSSTTIESVQIVGYTSPENDEHSSTQLGYQRAAALRDHIRRHHHLPDSIFEIADGGKNWELIYHDIKTLDIPDGDSLVARLKSEPSPTKREIMLRTYNHGEIYNELARAAFAKHRGATINAIYYNNKEDSAAITINNIINELIENPHPNYHHLTRQLHHYPNDARAINLQGVIDYRRHRRHAATKAFTKAAAMGDEQAAINLMIIENSEE